MARRLHSPTCIRISPPALVSGFPLVSQVVRNCDRLFPPDLARATNASEAAAKLKQRFTILGRGNERKRLASQLELKMRAIYYDVVDPAAVEGYVASIYQQVRLNQLAKR